MNKVLIVVDMQKDFIDGALGTPEAQAIVPNVQKKIDEYVAGDAQIVFTRDTHTNRYLKTSEGKKLPVVHCVKGTDGWQIPEDIDIPGCLHVDKHTFGYPYWDTSALVMAEEDGVEQIEIIGLCTDICVVSNALIIKALFPEIEIAVDARCCAGTTPEAHKAALQTMKSCQVTVIGE